MKASLEFVKKIFPHADRFGNLVGYRILELEVGKSKVELTIEDKHMSPSGAVHGGVVSVLVDVAMGAAVFRGLKLGERCSTIEFKINYLAPVQLGETITCHARIKFLGKSHAVVESHVYGKEQRDIATAMGTYNVYKVKDHPA